ncbi:Kelch repeat-containing protein [Tenacibaculum sp. IB213877]|uniref:Kelch repeat-containing protein n=1 Tax=Tenacibaculum sp. IB213877 TaxID=3097351 RepID=UPI002A59BD0E|nr:kelch repeat-containing protein [Tenacibaculum sp. IB213877]MDY0781433.1 kelch repeat-containing protein [Tenacibaculum sp. IB213877]
MNRIKKSGFLLLILTTSFFFSCSGDEESDEYGNWVESSTFDGNSRGNAVTFTIGNKGYLITGYNGDDYLADTWEYNLEGDYWVQKATFPGVARSGAVGFAINGKGYIGTGYDGNDKLKDFWEYNPETDEWTQKTDFAGTARYGAIGFSINGVGYIGTGYDGSEQKDFWKYDPSNNTWEQIFGFSGEKRQNGAVFVIDEIAYLGTGIHNGSNELDFYSFDGNQWTKLQDLEDYNDDDDDLYLSSGVGFSINGKGYFATGISGSLTSKCWVYEPLTDTWDEVPDFEGTPRQDASAFTFENTAFVLMGRSSSYYFDDVWEFKPDELEDDDD